MNTPLAPPNLGQNILVVMDSIPGFLDALRSATESLPHITRTTFTLLCCHPTSYWEHSGADTPEAEAQIEDVWQAKNTAFDRARHCLEQARAILQDAGVPNSQIITKTTMNEDSIIAATMYELKRYPYTGVIVSRYHNDIVNRLQRRGLTDMFRKLPDVRVWSIDSVV